MPLEQIDMWAQVWIATTPGEKKETRFNWHTKLSNMLKDGGLSEACGPTAATIEALLEIGVQYFHGVASHSFGCGCRLGLR